MLFRMIFDDKLAQAAYLIGCQQSGEAIVIDPERDVDRYVAAARKEGLRIVAAAETHIHADFLSGSRELAERTGARLYLSGEGGPDWNYRWLDKKAGGGSYDHRLLKNGDTFKVGQIELRATHTPGHTPEHLCYLVTDKGGGAGEPMGIVTGDFVFVGDLGRPDLLESAAGHSGAAAPSAHRLFASVKSFLDLPDYLQVWPAHGAGSACGKALGAVPQSTVGYERRHNAAIRAASSEAAFTDFILSGQPEPPMYFARMKRDNRDGPALLPGGELPRPRPLTPAELKSLDGRRVAIIDTRPWKAFKAGHVPGSLYLPLNSSFNTDAGSFVRDDEDIYLIVEPARIEEAVRDLVRIGLDRVVGSFDPSALDAYERSGGKLIPAAEIDIAALRDRLGDGAKESAALILDVRRASEFEEGHMPGSVNIAHTRLAGRIAELPRNKRLIVHCRSGGRSARAVAYLQRAGYEATNLDGGMLAWEQASGQVER